MTDHHDIVSVGGGTAGCVLAHRLSANLRLRVVLIEARCAQRPSLPRRLVGSSSAGAAAAGGMLMLLCVHVASLSG
jgi:choline dehydrogenase-like flavoprotein